MQLQNTPAAELAPKLEALKMENTHKRDVLIADELRFQAQWEHRKLFESDAPGTVGDEQDQDKFYATTAYPYMNGRLHAGHAFTWTKVEFMIGFARMQGKRALMPQGYHCTGMPIKAAADKLAREVEMFGKTFEGADSKVLTSHAATEDGIDDSSKSKSDMSKFSGNKSKAAAKTVKAKYQFQIMLSIGVPIGEIHRFADPQHWLQVFPQQCEADLRAIGGRVDWRRSMVTTPSNPFYDAFIRWQMNSLKDLGTIKFGKRFTIYSPKDGQACLDHDRSAGEGITPQEYVAVKLKALQWSERASQIMGDKIPATASVYFIPATLRPETMYGQTCCFVGPVLAYGVYLVPQGDAPAQYYICSERSARNMAYQGIFPWGDYRQVASMVGSDLVGTLVDAPLSVHKDGVYILPMETVKSTKGTGVVTCVPSDSPDDYATVLELAKKASYYGIEKQWAEKDITPIIQTPSSNLIAKHLVQTMKIHSPKDTKQLAEAKEQSYKEGFYQGTMLYGDFAGMPVQDAKPLVRKQLMDSGLAFHYAEPDGLVVSRSGDECVAAYMDQWYFNYGSSQNGGDQAWYEKAKSALETERVGCFYPEAYHAITQAVDWLGQWACSRSFGLGTRLPWDESQLVESLSDSSVYMAYYTISHFLHGDIFGKTQGKASRKIAPEEMTDGVWNYLFGRADNVTTEIPRQDLDAMRREFSYWYPLDARVSGKDLITNHLIFFLYHHVVLFDEPKWPRGIRVNGHLMLNGDKMSKSTGNFLTLGNAVEKYGADASRIAFADAGDGIEDANFDESVANATILRLYELRRWCHGVAEDKSLRDGELGVFDKIFDNDLNTLILDAKKHYEDTAYRLALKSAFYDMVRIPGVGKGDPGETGEHTSELTMAQTSARDWYRDMTKATDTNMHRALIMRYIELQGLLISPIAPHFSEFLYQDVLKHQGSVQEARYPDAPAPDPVITATRDYMRSVISSITAAESLQSKKLAKGKASSFDPKQPKKLTVVVNNIFPAWQQKCIEHVARDYQKKGALDTKMLAKDIDKKDFKRAMPFVQLLIKRLDAGEKPEEVFALCLPFDEVSTLEAIVPGLKQTVSKLDTVEITVAYPEAKGIKTSEGASPGYISVKYESGVDPIDNGHETERKQVKWQKKLHTTSAHHHWPQPWPPFRHMSNVKESGHVVGEVSTIIAVPDVAGKMPKQHMHDHIVHPSTMDSMFQDSILSIVD